MSPLCKLDALSSQYSRLITVGLRGLLVCAAFGPLESLLSSIQT
ncbi:hypothetical protein QZH41_017851, partial [Actinostola sp. cb2023]